MPAICAHYFFGLNALKKLRNDIRNGVDINAFMLGLQGPDILFFRAFWGRKYHRLGAGLHRNKNGEWFKSAAKHIKDSGDMRALSYMLGYICHYTLDGRSHPYVRLAAPDYQGHSRLEAAFDSYVIEREGGEDSADFRAYEAIPRDPEVLKSVSRIYMSFFPNMPENSIGKSIKNYRVYTRIFHDPIGIKYLVMFFIESFLRVGHFLSGMIRRPSTSHKYSEKTSALWRIYTSGILEAAELANSFHDASLSGAPLGDGFSEPFS